MLYLLSLFVLAGVAFLALAYLVDFKIEFSRPRLGEPMPKRPYLKGCGPFELKGTNEWGVFLIHGLSGSPAQMKPLAKVLNEAGMTCYAPVLPGHATHPDDLFYIEWDQWYGVIREEYIKFRTQHEKVMVIGFSLGAALAIRLGTEFADIDRCVCISTPGRFFHQYLPTHYVLKLAWLFSNVSRAWPKRYPQGPDGPEYLIYRHMPLDALFAVTALCDENKKVLDRFSAPLLMLHSENDPSCKVDGARYIYSHVSSPYRRLVMFEKAPHGLMHDGTEEQQELLVENVLQFAKTDMS